VSELAQAEKLARHEKLEVVVPAGTGGAGAYTLAITPERAAWSYSSLNVLELPAGASHTFATGEDEWVVLPLAGSCTVACDGQEFALAGRRGVFTRVTDFAYVPRDAEVTVTVSSSEAGGRFALCGARATRRLPARYGPAEGVQVELRGAGQASRQVNNFCTPATFEADRLIAVEVITPGGNWSSYPPHKHDEQRPGESRLEEVYYFEADSAYPAGRDGACGYQRVYGSGPGKEIDVCAEVRSGDAILIPHGWHGPAMAAPGYDLYYLNVMAGPDPERVWNICDDPAHTWVRSLWEGQPIDPRLPRTTTAEKHDTEKHDTDENEPQEVVR
jgi:5-deoxy-glucuronate isomerase